jgi:flagellin
MGLRIATNIQSLKTQRHISNSSEISDSASERLSSGYRINKASDDAAGLAISEKLKADIRGLNMSKRNANDGISLVQTAEGSLSEVGNILVRLRELAIQGASDTIGGNEREFLNKEFSALKSEITRITLSTQHNGTNLLVGNQDRLDPALRAHANPFPLDIQVGKDYYPTLDNNPNPINIIRIDMRELNASLHEEGLNLGLGGREGAYVADKAGAQGSIDLLDKAINKVSGYRATLGSVQSRLNSTIQNLSISSENASAANSRIRDADMAEEASRSIQGNIIKQAGIAVLAQANQSGSAVLRLLG